MDSENDQCCGGRPCPPPFPIFPIVCPLIFPIGFAMMLVKLGRRRRRGLEARITSLEEKVESLAAAGQPRE